VAHSRLSFAAGEKQSIGYFDRMRSTTLPQDEFDGALRILRRYYGEMMQEFAEEVIENADEFKKGKFGKGDALLERQSDRLRPLCSIFANLHAFGAKMKPEGTAPLSKEEFRRFGCGGVIGREDNACRLCGWTWK